MFNEPNKGDIWIQTAKIKSEENNSLHLVVSDEHGGLFKETKIPKHLFYENFFKHPYLPQTFIKKVRVEEIEENYITFVVIDLNDKPIKSSLLAKVKKEIFLKTYHLPQEF